jgi:hypothetical protein
MACNKLFKVLAPGDKVQPRLNVWAGNQTSSWLFDMGAATCTYSRSFLLAFAQHEPRKISMAQSCIASSGDAMNSIGVYEVDLWIKGKKFTHPVNVIKELNGNIIGIDFMHMHNLTYDMNTRQVKFADTYPNTICAVKQMTIPAMTSSVISVKFNVEVQPEKTYIANIHCPRKPKISGMPAIISVDQNNNCKLMVENCAPYDITIERNDLMGLLEVEEEELIPLTDNVITSVCADIHTKLPKIKRNRLSR